MKKLRPSLLRLLVGSFHLQQIFKTPIVRLRLGYSPTNFCMVKAQHIFLMALGVTVWDT